MKVPDFIPTVKSPRGKGPRTKKKMRAKKEAQLWEAILDGYQAETSAIHNQKKHDDD